MYRGAHVFHRDSVHFNWVHNTLFYRRHRTARENTRTSEAKYVLCPALHKCKLHYLSLRFLWLKLMWWFRIVDTTIHSSTRMAFGFRLHRSALMFSAFGGCAFVFTYAVHHFCAKLLGDCNKPEILDSCSCRLNVSFFSFSRCVCLSLAHYYTSLVE